MQAIKKKYNILFLMLHLCLCKILRDGVTICNQPTKYPKIGQILTH
uniref:Uncharacterized protein n=1 Tax=Anguilla anguilla TaxID=7936 RepID=A0A0E9R5K3_ANGAN